MANEPAGAAAATPLLGGGAALVGSSGAGAAPGTPVATVVPGAVAPVGGGPEALAAKAAAEKATADKAAADKAAADAPLELKLPAGFKDDPAFAEFKTSAKELGLKSEGAQKLFDLYAKSQAAAQAAADQAFETQQKEWVEAAKSDKDFGGVKFDASLVIANKAIAKFVDKDTVKFLADSGLGNHPGLVRAFHAIGKAIGEDSLIPGAGGEPKSAANTAEAQLRARYPNSPELFAKTS